MKRYLFSIAALLVLAAGITHAQGAKPVTVAIFPFKNLTGEVVYDDLSWNFADSLYAYFLLKPESETIFHVVPMDDVRDQMLALNVDVKSPSYENDVWQVAQALGADKIVWGTYYMKYDVAQIEVKVPNAKTMMHDPQYMVKNLRPDYKDALLKVPFVGDKILPAMK